MFDGWVGFAERCRACGLDYSSFNVGDGPAAFLIFIVGTITVVGALLVDGAFSPPWWVHLVWIPVATALTIGGLRCPKRGCSPRNIGIARAKGGSRNEAGACPIVADDPRRSPPSR